MASSGRTTGRRADAERNIATILAAAGDLFARGGNVSMADVAKAAGLGRVTVYAHFPSRADLLRALTARHAEQAREILDHLLVDADEPSTTEIFTAMVAATWQIVGRLGRLRAQTLMELGPEGLETLHDPVRIPLEELLTHGRADGTFRTDTPLAWQMATVYALIHAAMDEVAAGRLPEPDAPPALTTTLLAALT